MKHTNPLTTLVLSLLTAGLIFAPIPEASAKSSKAKLKRCLSTVYPVRLSETQFGFFNGFPYVQPLFGAGRLRVKGGRTFVSGRTFIFTSISLRGRRTLIARGRCVINGTVLNNPGSVFLKVVKSGRRATIRSGRYSYQGVDFFGNTFNTSTGRITGSKRLPRNCR